MNSLTKQAIAAVLALTAAAVAHADVCANPTLSQMSSQYRANAPAAQTCLDASTKLSSKIADSYNTTGSFNPSLQITPVDVRSKTSQATTDTQAASNDAVQVGPKQTGLQGGFSIGAVSAGGGGYGGYFSPVTTGDSSASNKTIVNGPNMGTINSNALSSSGGDAVNGDKAGILNSTLGNSQALTAGAQTLGQANNQQKTSSNRSVSSTPVTTVVTH